MTREQHEKVVNNLKIEIARLNGEVAEKDELIKDLNRMINIRDTAIKEYQSESNSEYVKALEIIVKKHLEVKR
jgi:predicted AlkP superfamily phosphohydrolase/phosphomutase